MTTQIHAIESTAGASDPGTRLATSGLLSLIGTPERPRLAGGAVLAAFDQLAATVAEASDAIGRRVIVREALLTERARLLGLSRKGRVSPNGACRLLRAQDGWLAVNLPRSDDIASVPAWLEVDACEDAWRVVEREIQGRSCSELLERARLLGLAVTRLPTDPAGTRAGSSAIAAEFPLRSRAGIDRRRRPPLVVDLSTLWAGPLAGQVFRRAGATVIKVECVRRPDAVHEAAPEFFERLACGKERLRLDFTCRRDLDRLRALIGTADVVLSSARARALDALGLSPERMVERHGGLIWIAITGHGLRGERGWWIGFGDDCAVAGGLVARDELGGPMFLGDAIADPLTGLRAAALGLRALRSAEGRVLDVSLSATAAAVARSAAGHAGIAGRLVSIGGRWHYVGPRSCSAPVPIEPRGPVPSGFGDAPMARAAGE